MATPTTSRILADAEAQYREWTEQQLRAARAAIVAQREQIKALAARNNFLAAVNDRYRKQVARLEAPRPRSSWLRRNWLPCACLIAAAFFFWLLVRELA